MTESAIRPISLVVIDLLDNLTLRCAEVEGPDAARAFRQSITGLCIEDGVVTCCDDGPHADWIIDYLNDHLPPRPEPQEPQSDPEPDIDHPLKPRARA